MDKRARISKNKSGAGFTLIEVVIYLALFTIMMGGMVAAAYSIFESSGRDQTKIMVQEEGNFLLAKINWALSGIQVNSPLAGQSSSILSVNKWDISGSPIAVTIDLLGEALEMSRAGNSPLALSNSNVEVSNLSFTHFADPEYIQASFTLTALTPNGAAVSQDFSTIKYLRK